MLWGHVRNTGKLGGGEPMNWLFSVTSGESIMGVKPGVPPGLDGFPAGKEEGCSGKTR